MRIAHSATYERRERPDAPPTSTELLHAILASLKRLERAFDEYAGVNLNAKFPYGKPTDRWRPRA